VATLVAVNVGLPRDVAWNDRVVHTGAWKMTVDGPRMVRRLNVDGDGQGDLGGHGGEQRAVLVYQLDSYRHWADFLDRDDLRYGHFGENFTVDGLPDDEVCIGDRYRIGDAVFEVTQPRVTCYRVGLRLNEPRMAALLVSHRRPGFYMRVITEGEVQAGQEIVKVASGPDGVSVAEIDALLYLPGHPRTGVQRALRIPALSPGWQASLRALADADGDGAGNAGLTGTAAPAPAWAGFRPLTVTAAHQESRRDTAARLAGGPVDHRQAPARQWRGTADPQLLAVEPARLRHVPDQRQA
jgi:MOSC domain-containing protein YiiM